MAEQPELNLQDAMPAAEPEAKPAPKRRGRKPKAVVEAEKAAAAEAAAAKAAPAADAGAAEEKPAPKRRGRKPKAVVEAEKAAMLAEQAAIVEAARAAQAASKAEASSADAAAAEAPAEDKRPGRARRRAVKKAEPVELAEAASGAATAAGSEEAAIAEKPKRGRRKKTEKAEEATVTEPAETAAPAAEAAADAASEEPAPKRRGRKKHVAEDAAEAPKDAETAKNEDSAKDAEASAEAKAGSKAEAKTDSKQADDARSSKDAPAKGNRNHERADRNDRGDRRRDRQRDRKQRNNRHNAPVEPSLSRDELSAMKVAELREKAREFDIETAGVKKAELVELVYNAAAKAEGFRDIEGILDMDNQGFGYIRANGYMPSKDDAYVPQQMVRAARLRPGDVVAGTLRPSRNDKYPALAKIRSINGRDPEEMRVRPRFSELTPIYPNEQLKMEHGKDSITGRAIDIVSPIGKGQRGLIVSPPKAGKTTILKKICQSIAVNNPEVHLICLLVDERPEEVTDMQRSIRGDVVASTFDMPADNHTRVSELVIERAKRIVEMGGDVVIVLDSITRLARAYNLAAPASGRILSGGVDSASLYPPKRFLGAARNIENGGSLTIIASALIDTGSKMDEVIFEEFKGTGNMELKLDRDLADRRIFPAIDPVASGTRNENLLIDENMQPFFWGLRRILANMNNTERAAASFIKGLKATNSNQEFLIRSAKKAQEI